jgi:hypothetical protein
MDERGSLTTGHPAGEDHHAGNNSRDGMTHVVWLFTGGVVRNSQAELGAQFTRRCVQEAIKVDVA